MSQKTDLNVSPYFDDFDSNNNFYRVLFKPGYPVQSRELTTLQTVLQNQIESFGSHFFKDGTCVIPGNIIYDSEYYAVRVEDTHLGIDIGFYLKNLIGKTIRGQDSQLTALVQNVVMKSESSLNSYTLYVKYLNSDVDFKISQFRNGETLVTLDSFTYLNTTINSGETIASLVSSNATSVGSAVSISKGVYFIRGYFVSVGENTLILDQYTNTPSYRVGLNIQESIEFASTENPDLYDNARGFSNFSAPGADRLKISAILDKKAINDFDDKNFVELLRVSNGVVKKIQDTNSYSLIKEYIAKRTYEESGDYSVVPFNIDIQNSLNDRVSSNGFYFENQKTDQDSTPSENLLAVKVSPGKAYVKGFDIEKSETTILDVQKPRDVKSITRSSVPFEMGNLIRVNNVSGTPRIGIDNNYTIDLLDKRKNSSNTNQVGIARVYAFNLTDSSYSNATTSWDLYLFDVQTYTKLTLNQSLNSTECPKSSYIKGLNSGASGYAVSDASGVEITLSQTSGKFNPGEQILINGSSTISRSIVSLREYNIGDIKSVFQNSSSIGLSTNFSADTFLFKKTLPNFSSNDVLSISPTGIATCAGRTFIGIASDTIIRYQRPGFSTETFNRISSISSDGLTITLAGVATVSNVCDGAITNSSLNVTFSSGIPSINNGEKAQLYAKLNNKNISDVNFNNSQLRVVRQVTNKSTNDAGTLVLNISDTGVNDSVFESFDSERYSVFYSDGSIEQLTSDKFNVDATNTQVTLSGLVPNRSNITVNATIIKNLIRNKQKIYSRSQKLEIDKTRSDTSTFGLTKNSYYGLRVEDDEISLNVPDVSNIIAIYESLSSTSPILDSLTFGTGLNLDLNAILGERIIGETSGAVGQLVTKNSSTTLEFVYLNSNKFVNAETVKFVESNIRSPIESIRVGSYIDRTQDYTLDKGQKEQYIDYSKIVRNNFASVPARKLLIIFDLYDVPSNDSGDVYTANSYAFERYEKDIPILKNNTRATDILDFRPKVSVFAKTTASPFDFSERNFSSSGVNPSLVVKPNESSTIGYSYYLPRIDKIVLNKRGNFAVTKGISADIPKEPSSIEDAMDIATIEMPAYLYDVEDINIKLIQNKRYTMKDIETLERRIENVEISSSLSLLEVDTKSLQIQDTDGLNRFKSGFFVDNFKTNNFIELSDKDSKCIVDKGTEELNCDISTYSLKSELGLAGSLNSSTADFSTNLQLLDSNVRKTGDLITLNYSESEWNNLGQNFATTRQVVNPFGAANYNGFVKLTPSSDTWVRSINSQTGVVIRSQGDWQNTFIDNLLLSTNPSNKFKSRNIEFYASGLNRFTEYYPFFDGNSNIDYIPKLLQITMVSNSFEVGEIVDGYFAGNKVCCFRLATATHKKGTYNDSNPTETYAQNPYNNTLTIPGYSSSSTILNIDTYSMADDSSGRFYGYAPEGTILIGRKTGSQASVSRQRLVTDGVGDLVGCIFIRNPLQTPTPSVSFASGTKTFKLSSNSTNSTALNVSFTQNIFYATGILNPSTNTQYLSVRKPSLPLPLNARKNDPLSQTFRTDNEGGFLTSVDLYFAERDTTEKLFVEIRETDLGGTPLPNLIQDYARAEVLPSNITVTADGSTPTNIKFPSPIYLEPNKQYAICLLCSSSNRYSVWVAQNNQPTVATQNLPDAEKVFYSNNYTGGNLYKPQNGSIWNSSVSEDLKFRFYKCNFTSSNGTVYFHNPNVFDDTTSYSDDFNIPKLTQNPIKTYPRKLVVGIKTSSNLGSILIPGKKVEEDSPNSTYGYIENVGGNISGITTTNVGAGYSNGTFTNVPLYNIVGYGVSATANITFANNKVSSISIASSGSGYVVGDVLGITTSSVVRGYGARITVSSTQNIDTLYLTNVKGEQFTPNLPLAYYNGSTKVSMASTLIRGNSYVPNDLYSGNVIEVTHYNHGMHADNNIVAISNVSPDTIPESLTAAVSSNTLSISIANTSNFTTFEGLAVSSNNPGFIIVNNEIISYTAVQPNSLTVGQRGRFSTPVRTHSIGDLVYKYEVNGISLSKINTTHNLPSNQTLKLLRNIDKYHLQINRGESRSSGVNQLSFNDEKVVGGSQCSASQNIQFSSIIPYFNILKPENTSFSSVLRTISGTSANGSETSFLDQNFQPIVLNNINYFDTPRLIASRVNEVDKLSSFTNRKSLTLGITFSTNNSNLSPVVDVNEAATFILNRNRINRPVSNYSLDSRVNEISGDPHSSVYVSKRVNLTQPANSLKVILTAYRHSTSDFRVLYKLFKSDSSEVNQSYQLFPGYSNLTDKNNNGIKESILDVSLSDGSSDVFVRSSNNNEFLEYQFTANDIGEFTGFVIKIVMSGTNEAFAPRFRDLRAIALL